MLELRGASLARAGQLLHPGYPAGSFTWMTGRVVTSAVGASDTLRLYPFFLAQRRRVSSIFTNTTNGGAGSALKCAVWRNDYSIARATGLPVLGQNAGFTTTDTGIDIAAIAGIWLDAGVWWAGEVHTGTAPTMYTASPGDLAWAVSQPSPNTIASGWLIAQPYADDIMALDLTGAALVPTSANVAAIGLGWS